MRGSIEEPMTEHVRYHVKPTDVYETIQYNERFERKDLSFWIETNLILVNVPEEKKNQINEAWRGFINLVAEMHRG